MRDFAIHLTHRPGELGRVANVLGRAGINVKSVAGMTLGNQAVLRLIADDIESARAALQEANIRFEEGEVVSVLVENRAGELAEVADKLSNAGVNVHAIYLTGKDGDLVELAVIADDPKRPRSCWN